MTKRLLAVVLAVMMVIGCTVSANAYTDVSATDKHALAIETLSNMEIIVGTTATEFNPNGLITREQMALLIARLSTALRVDASQGAANNSGFTDVVDSTYFDAINYCKNFGIIQGRDETTYDPKGNIILQDAVTMAVRAMGYTDLPYPAGYIQRGAIFGLFNNLTGSYTAPITRAEAAQLMYNALYSPYFTINGGQTTTTMMDVIYDYAIVRGQVVATPNFYVEGVVSGKAAAGTITVVVDDTTGISVDGTVVKAINGDLVTVAKADADALLAATCDIYTYTTVKGTKTGLKFGDSLINTNWFLSGAQSNGFDKNILTADTNGKVTILGKTVVKANKVDFFTIVDGMIDSTDVAEITDDLCITTALTDGDNFLLIQRPVLFGTVAEGTKTVNGAQVKYLKVGDYEFANTLGLTSVAVAKNDKIFYVVENGKATAIKVATPEVLRYTETVSGDYKFGNGKTYEAGTGFVAPSWKLANPVTDTATETVTYVPAYYNVYTLGNKIYSAAEKVDATPGTPGATYPKETTYVAKNYLIVRNIVEVEGETKTDYDANGIPTTTTTPAKYYAFVWMNGALTKIELDTVDGEPVMSSPLSSYKKNISSAAATTDINAFCAYEYNATKNTYKLYTHNSKSGPSYSTSWDAANGKWQHETGFNNGGITTPENGNLGDQVLTSISTITYDNTYGIFTVDGSKRFKLGTNSKITVAVAKTDANGNKYYEYRDYSAAKLPNFTDVTISGFVGVFCGTNGGVNWDTSLLQAVNVYVIADKYPEAAVVSTPDLLKDTIVLLNANAYKGVVYNEAGAPFYSFEGLQVSDGTIRNITIAAEYNAAGTDVKDVTTVVPADTKALILNTNGEWVVYDSANIVDGSASGYKFINISGNQYFINDLASDGTDKYETLTINGIILNKGTTGQKLVTITKFSNGNIAGYGANKTGYLTKVMFEGKEAFWVIQSAKPATGNTYVVKG